MRLLADENFPDSAVLALQASGQDLVSVGSVGPGMADPDVLTWLARKGRGLLTFDKDFGELARASALPSPAVLCCFASACPGRAKPARASLI